ncbi:MAG: OmpA family protein [Pseudomonadota bacterium]|nr:OmpA family protein [Pseudomonadota bacterium]
MKKTLSILLLGTALVVGGCSHRCGDNTCMKDANPAPTCSKTPAHFAFDSAVLDQADRDNLEKVAQRLNHNPNEKVRISGYTDSTGAQDYNMTLSKERAQSAARYLESLGISANRISIKGYGATHFVAPNETANERAQNRRIEVSFY